ncbi:MAG TPA: hypothetical protein VD731_06005 [Nitrosopumilaceae archaeon]|nr:hypothetical protein [Nitrosopumilaceae archaeon]
MKKTPKICSCTNCKCAIYTYEDSGTCKACNEGSHLSGAVQKDYTKPEEATKLG